MCFKNNIQVWGLALVFTLSLIEQKGTAQIGREENWEEFLLEKLLEISMNDELEDAVSIDFSDYLERLSSIHARPYDLNAVSSEELRLLGFLSPLVIGNIIEHRRMAGRFISVHELQAIKGMDLETAQFLSYFVFVRAPNPLEEITYRQLSRKGHHEATIRHGRILERQTGYAISDMERSRYLGSPDRLLMRYRYRYASHLRVFVNMEKDPGEQFFGNTAQQYGFDFYSLSIEVRNQGRFASLILGDYQLQWGQGLGIWQGFTSGKGALMHGIAKQGIGLRPHTSADEINFFRGIAATIRLGNLQVTPFVSFRQRDSDIRRDSVGNKTFSSLGQSGLHRTPNEVANRFELSQYTFGVNMESQRVTWKLGGTFYHNIFGGEWIPRPAMRNRFNFSGSTLSHTSMYYHFNFRNGYFFGEAAASYPGGIALLNGALLNLHHHVSIGLLHRYYQRDHHTLFGRPFAEGNVAANEEGVYSGLVYQPSRSISFVLYYDLFRFPWFKYRVDAPSGGLDLLSEFTYSWSRRTKISARFRYRERDRNVNVIAEPLPLIGLISRRQARVNFETHFGDRWRIRNRFEYVSVSDGTLPREHGWMFFQDLFYQPLGSKITGNIRLALFATSSYETRIYAFENDVLHASSFPAYHDRGVRTYINARWKLSPRVDVWIRYALSRFSNHTEIGSGLDQIEGSARSELKTQLRIKIP